MTDYMPMTGLPSAIDSHVHHQNSIADSSTSTSASISPLEEVTLSYPPDGTSYYITPHVSNFISDYNTYCPPQGYVNYNSINPQGLMYSSSPTDEHTYNMSNGHFSTIITTSSSSPTSTMSSSSYSMPHSLSSRNFIHHTMDEPTTNNNESSSNTTTSAAGSFYDSERTIAEDEKVAHHTYRHAGGRYYYDTTPTASDDKKRPYLIHSSSSTARELLQHKQDDLLPITPLSAHPYMKNGGHVRANSISEDNVNHHHQNKKGHYKKQARTKDKKRCSNCYATQSPSWRRSISKTSKGNLLCNACGLYEKTAKRKRMLVTQDDGTTKVVRKRDVRGYCCSKCGVKDATRWRRLSEAGVQCERCVRSRK